MKFRKDSDQWPKDSLKRSLLLNYPGCKSTLEAFNLIKSQQSQTPLETPKVNEDYKIMRDAIKAIESAIGDFDIDNLSSDIRLQLNNIPLNNIPNVILWRDSWLKVLGEINGR